MRLSYVVNMLSGRSAGYVIANCTCMVEITVLTFPWRMQFYASVIGYLWRAWVAFANASWPHETQ